jgi:ribose 5-phosphate isomerase B
MGGRVLSAATGRQLVEIWLDAEYEDGRHQNRLNKISAIERKLIKE